MKIFISFKSRVCRICQPARSLASRTLAGPCKGNFLAPLFTALAFTLTAQQGHACTLHVTGVNFGSYDVFSKAALDSTGNIDVNCPSGVGYSMALTADAGTHTQRVMGSGAHRFNYNLYTTADHAVVWGDATSGTARVNGTGIGVSVNHGIYGRIPALQNVHPGSYSDTIAIMINF